MVETLRIYFAERDPWKKKPDVLNWLVNLRCFALGEICFYKFEIAAPI